MGKLAGQFQGHLLDKVLVVANEISWRNDPALEGTPKSMIADPNMLIEAKNKNAEQIRS